MSKTESQGHGTLWWLGLFLGLLLSPWILLLGWMGLVPGVSNLMGARTPEDLGVKYAVTDLKQLEAKTGIPLAAAPVDPVVLTPAAPPGSQSASAGAPPQIPPPVASQPLDLTLSQEELSAAINLLGAKRLPLRKVQVKLSAGAAEISGALDTSRLGDFLKSVGVRAGNAERISGWTKALGNDIPVYLKAEGGVQGSQLDLRVQSLRFGNIELPKDQIDKLTGGNVHSSVGGNDRYSIETLNFEEGALKFTGKLPTDWFRSGP